MAFAHRSALNENRELCESNERLEFLGDAVLELSTSAYLYHTYPDVLEGTLTNYRSSLVKTTTLASVARKLGMGERLVLSKGEERSGGRQNTALLADTFEAFIGALYLDQGFAAADDFLKEHLFGLLEPIRKRNLHKDAKSTLQELLQAKHTEPPVYAVVEETGPAHQRAFVIALRVGSTELARASGKTKQEAQQAAAQKALEVLQKA